MSDGPVFCIIIDGTKHVVGNDRCTEGWCGCHQYPAKCKCGGLIHANFGDENADGDYWLFEKCDRCGDEFEEADKP